MKNDNKGSFKNRIKGFYIEPGKFKKNRIKKDTGTSVPDKDVEDDDNLEDDGLV
jgi:hypothetical protein